MSILLSNDQIHDECWGFVGEIMSHHTNYKVEDGRGLQRAVEVFLPFGVTHILLNADMDPSEFMAWVDVSNDFTKRVYSGPMGTNDPLTLYAWLTEGVRIMLRSIEWKANEDGRKHVLNDLADQAATNVSGLQPLPRTYTPPFKL